MTQEQANKLAFELQERFVETFSKFCKQYPEADLSVSLGGAACFIAANLCHAPNKLEAYQTLDGITDIIRNLVDIAPKFFNPKNN